MNDGYGDGWNGAALTINGVDYTMLSGYSESVCVDVVSSGCIIMHLLEH